MYLPPSRTTRTPYRTHHSTEGHAGQAAHPLYRRRLGSSREARVTVPKFARHYSPALPPSSSSNRRGCIVGIVEQHQIDFVAPHLQSKGKLECGKIVDACLKGCARERRGKHGMLKMHLPRLVIQLPSSFSLASPRLPLTPSPNLLPSRTLILCRSMRCEPPPPTVDGAGEPA